MKPEMVWTPEMQERLRVLEAQRPPISYGTIAAIISHEFKADITRNACIGKAHRDKLPRRASPIPKPAGPRKMKTSPPLQQRERTDYAAPKPRIVACKWPLGALHDHPPFQFCRKPSAPGCPYCRAHAARAYVNPRAEWI